MRPTLRVLFLFLVWTAAGLRADYTATPLSTATTQTTPYKYVGLVFSEDSQGDWWQGSGAVVANSRIIVSCAHLPFNDQAFTWSNINTWVRAWSSSSSPPSSNEQTLRGFFKFANYADLARQQGTDAIATFAVDVAVFYAYENLAPGSTSYWYDGQHALTSGAAKRIVGYPSGLYSHDDYRMHETGPFTEAFTPVFGSYCRIDGVAIGPGSSGGPVFVTNNGGQGMRFAAILVAGLAKSLGDSINRSGVVAMGPAEWGLVNSALSAVGAGPIQGEPIPPTISAQPASQTVNAGVTVTFSVTASSTSGPLVYQWQKNDSNIAGATTSSLALSNVTSADTGSYTVVVSNDSSSVTSNAATLTVNGAPTITAQPASATINQGQSASFAVIAIGTAPLTYQWRKNGVDLPGATSATFTLNNVQPGDAGSYTVIVTSNGTSSVSSNAVTLTVTGARLSAIACRAVVGAGGDVLIPGIIIGGTGSKQVLVRASGPALISQGVTGTLAQPQLSLYSGSTVIAQNIGWSSGSAANTSALQAAVTQAGLAQFPAGSADCALLATLTPGGYTAIISGANNSTGVALVEVYELGTSNAQLSAIACRAVVGTGGNVLIPGIIVNGSGSKRVLVRVSGPALIPLGVSGALARPQLRLYSGSTVIAENIGWSSGSAADVSAVQAATVQVGLTPFPAGSADCALLATLQPGGYTAIISGVNDTTGVALIEVYEVP